MHGVRQGSVCTTSAPLGSWVNRLPGLACCSCTFAAPAAAAAAQRLCPSMPPACVKPRHTACLLARPVLRSSLGAFQCLGMRVAEHNVCQVGSVPPMGVWVQMVGRALASSAEPPSSCGSAHRGCLNRVLVLPTFPAPTTITPHTPHHQAPQRHHLPCHTLHRRQRQRMPEPAAT